MKSSSLMLRAGTILCAVVAVALIGQPIFASKSFLKKLKELYPDIDKKAANCHLCHTFDDKDKSKKEHANNDNVNAFGKTIREQASMKAIVESNKGKPPTKEGDPERKYSDEEMAQVETALKAVLPNQAALDKVIEDAKKK